ncbi:MAG TPA: hypothetical protein VGM54_13880 [Chthoniobacter sp.]
MIAFLTLAFGRISHAQDEESRKHLLHELGGPFFVSRDKVQEDLKLSDEQKQKLREKLSADVEGARTVENMKTGERGPAMQALRQTSYAKLEAFLKEILSAEQLQRFQQLKLQYETPAIMLQPEIGKALSITDEQRKQFMGVIQEMKKESDPLMKAAKSGGNPQEILAKVTKLRQDAQGRIEGLLSESQEKQWKAMTGPPLVIW